MKVILKISSIFLLVIMLFSTCKTPKVLTSDLNQYRLKERYYRKNDKCLIGVELGSLPFMIDIYKCEIKNNRMRIVLNGTVKDVRNNESIPFAEFSFGQNDNNCIEILKRVALTESDGSFTINEKFSNYDFLIVTAISYETQVFNLKALLKDINN